MARSRVDMNSAKERPLGGNASVDALAADLALIVEGARPSDSGRAAREADRLIDAVDRQSLERHADLLSRSCFYLFEIGKSTVGIELGKKIAEKAESLGNIHVQRRILNIVGLQYTDVADFPSAMDHLERAVVLARKIGDATIEAACLANVTTVLQEMGHYRQAIAMADRVVTLDDDSLTARMLKVQCASNGLFAAHRTGDTAAAARFLDHGQRNLHDDAPPLRRAFFERARTLYLVECGDGERAKSHLIETFASISGARTERIDTLLSISQGICDWSLGQKVEAREGLATLYRKSKVSRLYHHFVLQALVKVYGDAETPAEAAVGMGYARELVEFTTSVKKAKFYRQLANRRERADQRSSILATTTQVDPFDAARDWLTTSDIHVPPDDPGERRELTKHEELTAIHEDMARLRAASIRRDIRTDAVDTAENWAIAAEFFDDETGQHCYRVGHLASMLARQIGMDETFCVQVEHAARLHDIGKIAVNEVILLKPGPLDAAEMTAMRLHTEVGAQILAGSDDPTLKMAAEIARHHHEWWNGAGYPTRSAGKNIPLSARVCAYADVYDALTHVRSYKKAWSHERAVDEIARLKSIQFDPEMFEPFVSVLERYRSDLENNAIPGFADMDSNALIASRKRLMQTITADHR